MKSSFSRTSKPVSIPLKIRATFNIAGLNNDAKVSGRLLSSVSKGVCCTWKVALAEPVNQYLLLWKKQPVDIC